MFVGCALRNEDQEAVLHLDYYVALLRHLAR